MSILPPATIRLSLAEHRAIEREAEPRKPRTAGEWSLIADRLFEQLVATENSLYLKTVMCESMAVLLNRRVAELERLRKLIRMHVELTALERTAT